MTYPPITVDGVKRPTALPGEPLDFHDYEEPPEPPEDALAVWHYLDQLSDATHRIEWLQTRQSHCISELRVLGEPWAEIAVRLRISRQAAWKTYHHLDPK